MQTASPLLTVGQLAAECDVPHHRLTYALKAAGIQPVQRVGILRVWSADQLPQIREAVERIASRREAIGAR